MSASKPQNSSSSRDWAAIYSSRLVVTDVVVVVWAVFGTQLAWFGLAEETVAIEGRLGILPLSYSAVSATLCIAWVGFVGLSGSRDRRVVGFGPDEYQRILTSSLMLFGLLAIASYLLKAEVARGYLVTALPIGLLGLLISRWMWRQYLTVMRSRGSLSNRVVLVGSVESAAAIAKELQRTSRAGYLVVGAFISHHDHRVLPTTSIPILGTVDELLIGLDNSLADTVIVTSSDDLPPARMRQLSWSLEPGRQHLVVAPGLIDVAGPRLHTRPVAGLPLIHVETPRYEGGGRVFKRLFDIVLSGIGLLFLSVPFAVIAILIKRDTPGPVFFRQQRVGKNGVHFNMLKFRSMTQDAEDRLAELADASRTEGNSVMFKMATDPRVTRVGATLRRFSLDELPQLVNVFRGEMSLVGPRPPLPREVELYEDHVNRRFLVTPGITGLWQVSGRSDLDWESTVRLDLFYVENWSFISDLVILLRTAKAVLASSGAY